MKTGIYVEIKEFTGSRGEWTGRKGHVTEADLHCLTVRTDDGKTVRDVLEHFRTEVTDSYT